MTTVAVLMGLYGGDDPEHFERALASVLNQPLPAGHELHVYVGVDGPLPAALESIIDRFSQSLFMVSRSETNLGLARTLNRLIQERGDEAFFFRMDADDESLSGRFEAQLKYLDLHPNIDILGTAIWECIAGAGRRLVRFADGPEDALRRIDRRVPVAHPTVCMRRTVLDRLGGYPDRRGNEDISMWFKCLEAGFRFDNLPDAWLNFTVTDAFWKRRSVEKAFSECRSYIEGIWQLDGLTWRYVYPIARLLVRLSPEWISRRLYASRLRS